MSETSSSYNQEEREAHFAGLHFEGDRTPLDYGTNLNDVRFAIEKIKLLQEQLEGLGNNAVRGYDESFALFTSTKKLLHELTTVVAASEKAQELFADLEQAVAKYDALYHTNMVVMANPYNPETYKAVVGETSQLLDALAVELDLVNQQNNEKGKDVLKN